MPKREEAVRSFRAIAGALEDGYQYGKGMYLLDSNDTMRYYAFFAMTQGMTREAEEFCIRFIVEKTEPYMDTYRRGELSRPGAFLKSLAGDLFQALRAGDLATGDFAFALVLVKNGIVYVGRVNAMPVYILKDKRLKHVMKDPGVRGMDSIQVVGAQLSDGDMVLMGTPEIFKHITELELRSVLLNERDLSLVCSRINIQANKYEETADPRLLAVRFTFNHEESNKLFSKRNLLVMGGLAMLVLTAFLWNEISAYMRSGGPVSNILSKRKSFVRRVVDKVSMPRAVSFNIEPVFDGLTVPYDLAIGENGVLYIVDDKEEQIIKYTPSDKTTEKIGSQAGLVFPTGIDILGDKLFVADFSRRVNRVFVYDTSGNFLGRIPGAGNQVISMQNPKAIEAVESDNTIYVCDRGNNRILKFDDNGNYLGTIKIPDRFKEPNGMAVLDGGTIFVTLKMTGQIAKISGKNSIAEFKIFDPSGDSDEKVEFMKPSGIAVDADGNVYVADTGNQRIVVADQTGKLTTVIDKEKIPELETYYPMSVKTDPQGTYVYIVAGNRYSYDATCGEDKCHGKIWRIKL